MIMDLTRQFLTWNCIKHQPSGPNNLEIKLHNFEKKWKEPHRAREDGRPVQYDHGIVENY